ncbi:sulfite exporter TauE/SafE family protein [Parvularcula dongshanensis]|uniref:Probable membrane transporter protein n=1 Tax=Parvularcula dongshanensis TaxID=1173995 RepID=A0A840I0R3_9PROT|nr:sulfite exporter TauE/SafE family protein [Parvularcula dongshanensis]MBB4657792.1 putative membrane protein YfcA [Parvularcula dongshanensis]
MPGRIFSRSRAFPLWLVVFYTGWLALMAAGRLWGEALAHWPIAVAMAVGSYFAGSTPMGGGTVGFPVLTLIFGLPASLGRGFALAVQSVGMTSASIYILSSRKTVDWALLRPALVGATLGVPFGAAFLAPHAPDLGVKLLFAVVWASFGIIHLTRFHAIVEPEGGRPPHGPLDRPIGLGVGFVGGIVASLTGVGIDMMIYAALVLFFRTDLKVAIPTSVILMAYASLLGTASNVALGAAFGAPYGVPYEVFLYWIAAAPVVAVGAPFGALVVDRIGRKPTLILVSVLCVAQFAWIVLQEKVTGPPLLAAFVGLGFLCGVFAGVIALGRRMGARQGA